MDLNRRDLLKYALGLPTASWLTHFRALAAPASKTVKITAIKTMGLDNVGDGCLIRIETDAGIVGYGEAGLPSAAARERIAMMLPQLIGQDPIAIERHFYMMAATQYSFMANIPTVSGVDIALWDLAGKIIGLPVYRLIGGPGDSCLLARGTAEHAGQGRMSGLGRAGEIGARGIYHVQVRFRRIGRRRRPRRRWTRPRSAERPLQPDSRWRRVP
jgi:hypothetical protein